jgi:hypothetical protein
MDRMIGDAKLQLNHGGDAATGPDLPPEARRFGPTVQQLGQPSELLGRQPPGGTRGWLVPEGVRSALAAALHPLADRGFADTHGRGDVALGSALLLELPELEPSRFLPGVR